jgi:hypothetical protein
MGTLHSPEPRPGAPTHHCSCGCGWHGANALCWEVVPGFHASQASPARSYRHYKALPLWLDVAHLAFWPAG